MVCLLLLIGLGGIFCFVQLKKIKKWLACAADSGGCTGASLDSSWHPLPPWMARIWWFDVVLLEMAFLFFFLPEFACRPYRKSNQPFHYFFSCDSVNLLLFVIFFYLYWLFLIGFYFYFIQCYLIFEICFQICCSVFELLFILFS